MLEDICLARVVSEQYWVEKSKILAELSQSSSVLLGNHNNLSFVLTGHNDELFYFYIKYSLSLLFKIISWK
ncbi:MAG: hypothetical protein ACEY3J_01410 [Arsenophonus sp.]